MDKITHQVRVEYWAKIMNECINSGMPKTAWCRANGISEQQFFQWQRILRREAFENSQNSSLSATTGLDQELVSATQRAVSFTEVKLPSSLQNTVLVFHPDLVIRKVQLRNVKRLELGGFSWPRTKEEALETGAGDRLQTSDPGSASPGYPVRYCAKRRKSKFFSFYCLGGIRSYPQPGLIVFIQS